MSRCNDKLLRLIIVGRDGLTTNADHQRQQQPHINTVYVSPTNSCTWIAMLSILESMTVEIAEVLFGTLDFLLEITTQFN
jgi:hypothetical protein